MLGINVEYRFNGQCSIIFDKKAIKKNNIKSLTPGAVCARCHLDLRQAKGRAELGLRKFQISARAQARETSRLAQQWTTMDADRNRSDQIHGLSIRQFSDKFKIWPKTITHELKHSLDFDGILPEIVVQTSHSIN